GGTAEIHSVVSQTPTLDRLPFGLPAMPPMKGQSRSRNLDAMIGRRSLVLKTQWIWELTSDTPRIQPSLRDLCNSKFPSPTLKRWAIIDPPSGMMSGKSQWHWTRISALQSMSASHQNNIRCAPSGPTAEKAVDRTISVF